MNAAEVIVGSLCGVVIILILFWIGTALYIANTKIDTIIGHLKNSSSVMTMSGLQNGGPWGKLLLIGGISGFITFPKFYIKRGGLSIEDINNFPTRLRQKLKALQWSAIALFVTLASLVITWKSGVLH